MLMPTPKLSLVKTRAVSGALNGNNALRLATFSSYVSFRHDSNLRWGSFVLCDSPGFERAPTHRDCPDQTNQGA